MRTKIFIVLLVLLISFKFVLTQETDSIKKPKIGLVLSGGAAKGLSHIGVLKVLEEVGITPDYITGTSIGAVVGALYALGYSAKEISQMNANTDWEFLLSDRIYLNEVVFEEKYEYKRYIFGIPIRNYKFKLPSGVIEGQQLEKFFADIMWPPLENENFDSLPIPFHCMSVDLISGKTIEFESGNLSESVRASMSIPSLFTPESIDTMLLIDGGIIRNFPVNEVKEMGADLVIGIYVGFDDKVTKEDLFSLSDVLSRATVFYGIFDSKEQMEQVYILIEPDMKDFRAVDFTKSTQIEVLGEVAALEIKEDLYKLSERYNLKYAPVKKINYPDKIYIKEIKVINERPFVPDKFIIGRSGIKEGSFVSKEDLSEAVDKVFGTQYFKKVTYSLDDLNDSTYRLIFKVKERTRAFLNLAANYDNQYGPGLITNLTLRNYITPASRATVTFNISENPDARIDINKYIGKKERIMDNYYFNWYQDKNSLIDKGINIGSYKLNHMIAGVGGKYSISENQQVGLLGFYEIYKINPIDNLNNYLQVESFESYSHKGFAYKLYYNINTTDNKFFPHQGVKFDIYYKYNFKTKVSYDINEIDKERMNNIAFFTEESNDFYMTFFNFEMYNTFNKLTLSTVASAGISSEASAGIGNFNLGGYHSVQRFGYISFVGMKDSEAIVPNFGILRLGIDLEIIPKVFLTSKANIGFYTQSKDDMVDFVLTSSLKSYLKGYSAGVRANTIIGPINILYGDNDFDGEIRWYISIGYPF